MWIENTELLWALTGLGILVGSFLNVVIHRLPVMQKREWEKECVEFLEETHAFDQSFPLPVRPEAETYDLVFPSSHCPRCHVPLRGWHLIPVLSYFWLGGKCGHCRAPISPRYPIVEGLGGLVAWIAVTQFGLSLACFGVCLLGWMLIAVSAIDVEHRMIPDVIVAPLLWTGLLFSCFETFTNSHDAILGAILGYSTLWITGKSYLIWRKREGLGLGDCKLLAAMGAWTGWQLLPFMILTSCFLGFGVGALVLWWKKLPLRSQIPFAPFIAIAAWIGIIWGFDITKTYLNFFGIEWANV